MSETKQLDAHYAVLQLDNLRREVVMSFRPTVEMLVAEFDEQYAGIPHDSPERVRAKERRVERFVRYRAAVLELSAALVALRLDCGTDSSDLPHGDDDVPKEFSRIRAAHETFLREQAVEPVDDDVDEMIDRHREALVDRAAGERVSGQPVPTSNGYSFDLAAAADDALDALRNGGWR
jgi:hypothetical protein